VLSEAPEVVAVSRWLAEWASERGARAVRWVPNGVAVHPGGDRTRTRRALDVEDDVELLGFLGSGRAWHGVHALEALLEARPRARALVVGDARVAHPRARCVGRVSEARAAELVAAMDVLVAPYTDDAPPWLCPLKVLHARAQGTPVVARDVGDVALLLGESGGTVLRGWSTGAACEALDGWRGRRAPPHVRGWTDVVSEALGVSRRRT
jgi:glycosyltransferase involved in cell wall biosynthesis